MLMLFLSCSTAVHRNPPITSSLQTTETAQRTTNLQGHMMLLYSRCKSGRGKTRKLTDVVELWKLMRLEFHGFTLISSVICFAKQL